MVKPASSIFAKIESEKKFEIKGSYDYIEQKAQLFNYNK